MVGGFRSYVWEGGGIYQQAVVGEDLCAVRRLQIRQQSTFRRVAGIGRAHVGFDGALAQEDDD